MFLAGKRKTAKYIARVLSDAIKELGPKNVLQVVTDSAESCKQAGRLLEKKYKWLTWVPCAAHCLDLFLEDIYKKVPHVAELVTQARKMIFFMKHHQMALTVCKRFSSKALLVPGSTRYVPLLCTCAA